MQSTLLGRFAKTPRRVVAAMAMSGLLSLFVSGPVHAIDLGNVGPVYPISEPDFLVEVKAIVKRKVDNGEWQTIEQNLRRDTIESLEHPLPVGVFAVAQKDNVRYFDPTTILQQDILDPEGQVLFAAGTRVNPLDVVTVGSALFFFDADDPKQVAVLEQTQTRLHGQVKPVAVAGSYLALSRKLDQPIYFDQAATYTTKLGIDVVPTLVSQDGNQLKIEEIAPQ